MFGCTPARRSVKFPAGPHAHNGLVFDTAISKEERMLLIMELFTFSDSTTVVEQTSHGAEDTRIGVSCFCDSSRLSAFAAPRYTPNEYLDVRVCADPRHPAYGQAGLFAKKTIPCNTNVTPYTGFIEICSAASCSCYSSRTYTMGYGSLGDDYAIDAEFAGNYGRFANDPRGVDGSGANLYAECRFTSRGEAYTALVSRRVINEGEEILMSYGKQHNLTAGAWTDVTGEFVTRERLGNLIPFPAVLPGQSQRRADGPDRQCVDNTQCTPPAPSTLPPALSSGTARVQSCDTSGASTVAKPEDAMSLLWECPQCGYWSRGTATPSHIDCCHRCSAPRLARSRLVAMLEVASTPGSATEEQLQPPYRSTDEMGLPRERDEGWSVAAGPGGATGRSGLGGHVGSRQSFDAIPVTWPMNIPFLPWHVWDPTIPLSVTFRYSKLVAQERILLYELVATNIVDLPPAPQPAVEWSGSVAISGETGWGCSTTPLPRSRRGRRRRRSRCGTSSSTPNSCTSSSRPMGTEPTADSGGPPLGRQVKRLRATPMHSQDDAMAELNDDTASDEGWSDAPEAPVGAGSDPTVRLEARRGGAGDGTADEVGPGAVHVTESARGTSSVPAAQHGTCFPPAGARTGASHSSTCGGDGGFGLSQPEPQRLLIWSDAAARVADAEAMSGSGVGNKHEEDSPAVAGSTDYHLFYHRFHSLFSSKTAVKSVFAGEDIKAGDVVATVGGIIRLRCDRRVRVDQSPLEIPLHYFVTEKIRRYILELISGHYECCKSDDPLGQTESSGEATYRHPAPKRPREAGAGGMSEWDTQLLAMYSRMQQLSLVVTNEMMFCPTIAVEVQSQGQHPVHVPSPAGSSAERPSVGENLLHRALSTCNVSLILTFDPLGCPFVAAVAMRNLSAFEPLLARVGT